MCVAGVVVAAAALGGCYSLRVGCGSVVVDAAALLAVQVLIVSLVGIVVAARKCLLEVSG